MNSKLLFTTFPQLNNNILYTKMIDHNDDQEFVEIMMNPNCFKYTPGKPKQSIETAKHVIDHYQRDFNNKKNLFMGVYLTSTQKLIGVFEVFNINRKRDSVEIGYRFHESFWHQGYTTMACQMIVDYLLHIIQVKRVIATAIVENMVSNRLLNRSGFTLDKTIHNFDGWNKQGKIDLNYYHLSAIGR